MRPLHLTSRWRGRPSLSLPAHFSSYVEHSKLMKVLATTAFFLIILCGVAGCQSQKLDGPHRINSSLPKGYIEFPKYSTEYDEPPVFLKGKSPLFPFSAYVTRKTESKGSATIAFTISVKGRVEDIEVLEATHPQYAAAVIHNLKNWRFEPAKKNGSPVPYRMKFKWDLEYIEF